MKIGVLIPYLNCEQYVEQLVLSLTSQFDLKVLLIDNNSKLNISESMSDQVLSGDTECRRMPENIGVAGAWNLGLKELFSHADIDYVLVLNNDVLLHPHAIDNLVKVIGTGRFPIVTGTDVAKKCAYPGEVVDLPTPERETLVDEPEFSCFMISREGYALLGDFDQKFFPAYFEDNDYHYRARLLKKRLVKLNTALYYHYGSRTTKENEEVGAVVNTFYLQNEAYYVTKWGGKPGEEAYTIPFNGMKNE